MTLFRNADKATNKSAYVGALDLSPYLVPTNPALRLRFAFAGVPSDLSEDLYLLLRFGVRQNRAFRGDDLRERPRFFCDSYSFRIAKVEYTERGKEIYLYGDSESATLQLIDSEWYWRRML